MLEVGMKAPEFILQDQDGREVSLADYRGKKVVLYFYPKDSTPGCTRQACAFAGSLSEIKAQGAVVLGVSKDSVASHRKFADKYGLPFTLLSDPQLEAIQAYGVWQEKKLYGKVSMGVVRTTFVIDEAGGRGGGNAQGQAGYKRSRGAPAAEGRGMNHERNVFQPVCAGRKGLSADQPAGGEETDGRRRRAGAGRA